MNLSPSRKKLVVTPKCSELGTGKIAEHRRSVGGLHGQCVVRAFPGVGFPSVAASAGLRTNEARLLLGTHGHATHQRQYYYDG
jgi:hypothetical protein